MDTCASEKRLKVRLRCGGVMRAVNVNLLMRQAASGGGNRAQRDKEFFPEMSEREVAKAKSLVIGDTIDKAGGLVSDYKAALLRASGKRAEATKSGVANVSLSASLLASASTASTIQIANSSEREHEKGQDRKSSAAISGGSKASSSSSSAPIGNSNKASPTSAATSGSSKASSSSAPIEGSVKASTSTIPVTGGVVKKAQANSATASPTSRRECGRPPAACRRR